MQIESNIPVTPANRREWPFASMNVGDSFLVPDDLSKTAAVAARSYGKRHGMTFVRRKQPGGQTRLWRTA